MDRVNEIVYTCKNTLSLNNKKFPFDNYSIDVIYEMNMDLHLIPLYWIDEFHEIWDNGISRE